MADPDRDSRGRERSNRISVRELGGNLPIPEAKFHFQPPPGIAIVDEESLAGEIH